jgi:cell division protein FtsW
VIIWIGQAIINIATAVGLLPVIGVPLPFISYGGSAMVSSLAGIRMILAVTRRFRASVEKRSPAVRLLRRRRYPVRRRIPGWPAARSGG